MNQVCLRRADPSRNMARFYLLDLRQSLFGEWELVREFGRIGSPGRVMVDRFADLDGAASAMATIWKAKLRKGYAASR